MIIKTNQDEFSGFLTDASNFHGKCECVYFPETSQEVIDLVKL